MTEDDYYSGIDEEAYYKAEQMAEYEAMVDAERPLYFTSIMSTVYTRCTACQYEGVDDQDGDHCPDCKNLLSIVCICDEPNDPGCRTCNACGRPAEDFPINRR